MDGAELGEMSLHQGKISALTAERVRDSLRQQCIDAADAVAYRKEDIELEEAATTTGTVEEVEEKGDCAVEKARIEELKKEMASAKQAGSDDDGCRDSDLYSQPYEKREYDKKMKVTNYTSRCKYEAQKSPCDDMYLKRDCAKTCGVGSTDRGSRDGLPYVHYEKVKNTSTPIMSECEMGKKRGSCKHKGFKAGCEKTCGGGKEDKNKNEDRSHWYRHPWAWEKKKYASYCEFHKASGGCDRDASNDLYSDRRSRYSSPCRKTCTGKGKDSRESKEMVAHKYRKKTYKSVCAFRLKQMKPMCKGGPRDYRSRQVRAMCPKTCTGKGEDKGYFARPYLHREPVVKKTHKYKTKCEYIKEAGYCQSWRLGAYCRKTCGMCGKDGAREEEVRDEYKDIAKDLMELQNVETEDQVAKEFLEEEKERLERKKRSLEAQLKDIIDLHSAEADKLSTYIKNKKQSANSRLKERLRKRRNTGAPAKRPAATNKKNVKVSPEEIRPPARVNSPQKKRFGAGKKAKKSTLSPMKVSQGTNELHKIIQKADVAAVEVKDTAALMFQLIPYYKSGNEETDAVIEKHLKKGDHFRDAYDETDQHNSLLHVAAAHGNIKAAEMLIKRVVFDVNAVNEKNATPLHYAAARGDSDLCSLLIKHRANVIAVDASGHTPLSYAKELGHKSVVQLLQSSPKKLPTLKAGRGDTHEGFPGSKPSAQFRKSIVRLKWQNAAWRAGLKSLYTKGVQYNKWQTTAALAQARKELEFEIQRRNKSSSQSEADAKELAELKAKLSNVQTQFEKTKAIAGHGQEVEKEKENLEVEVTNLRRERSAMGHELGKESKLRKKLHNTLEDMKGKIRVFARIRPLSSSELAKGCKDICEYSLSGTAITLGNPVGKKRASKSYEFDSVFTPQHSQEQVFEDVNNLIQSTVDGYNVCIFAYGQTGSGKTFTMSGNKVYPGILPRAITSLFHELKVNGNKIDYKVSLYMAEIYLDEIIDLLQKHKQGKKQSNARNDKKLKVKKDAKGRVYVDGITTCTPSTAEEVSALIESGMRNRHVSATKMNSESSRSHLITSISIEGRHRKSKAVTVGKLMLVDLAGSESQQKTGATGDTLKEANAINTSLSALGGVISALTTGAKFIPYRGNKLTEILQDGLGGSAKTLMFVNASPADYNKQETMGSFEFALRCKEIKKEKASAVVESAEVRELKMRLSEMQSALEANGVKLPGDT